MHVTLQDDSIRLGTSLTLSFVRTTKVPETGRPYSPPSHNGLFPLRADVRPGHRAVLSAAVIDLALIAPTYPDEAMWIAFEGRRPHAI
jgi:hypothetical protein